ncbi:unnamed protein product [Oikopleura dioica]|uniref:Potassium channel tetramerisation-type BTB domain-containing protein n=1 Tax=Oikopleura dioica TaxID=34765 RepID=E4YGP8_OIKDI|nr:unnamed protein product [Oikopleura dioica]
MKTLLEDDEIVRINVGGIKFTTLRSTLLRYSHSILARMINGKIPPRRDSEGNAFLDRDPQIFKFILEFLRSSKVVISDDLVRLLEPVPRASLGKSPIYIQVLNANLGTRQGLLSDLLLNPHSSRININYPAINNLE